MYFIFYCISWILKALRATQEMASFDLNHLHMKAPSVSQFFCLRNPFTYNKDMVTLTFKTVTAPSNVTLDRME